ncbi:MAG: hypothetical protein ACFFEV_04790 [Candidatus Thorarchaeota archaeon]
MTNESDPQSDTERVSIGFRLTSKIATATPWSHDDPDDLLELYGTSPFAIGIIMVFVTVFFPIGVINVSINSQTQLYSIYSAFWMIANPADLWGMFILEQLFSTFWITIPLCTLNFLFIIQINRFFSNTASRDVALMIGILSMLAPTIVSLYFFVSFQFPYTITPIPIQFFVGIYLIYKFRDPDYVSPWKGYFVDWSWWIRQDHTTTDKDSKVINLTQLLMQHDADWLEGWLDEDEQA